MKKPTDIGNNRTGIGMSPVDSKMMQEGAVAGVPSASTDIQPLHDVRLHYSQGAEPLGTVPPPATAKGVAKAAVTAVKGKSPTVFLDMLGSRLGFERTGVRLYELLMVKWDAADVHEGGPAREDLEHHRDAELRHMDMVVRAVQTLGADPTAITPCADATAVSSMGHIQVLSDPRTTLTEGLEAIRAAELVDFDQWENLAALADQLGHHDMAEEFREALEEEREHLTHVRSWLQAAFLGQAGIAPTPSMHEPGARHV